MGPTFILCDNLNLGNALSAYGSFCLLAEQLNGGVVYPNFALFQSLFENSNIHVFDMQNRNPVEMGHICLKVAEPFIGGRHLRKIAESYPIVRQDKYYRYIAFSEETIILDKKASYYCPLEMVDVACLKSYKYILVLQPYQMQYQFCRNSNILLKHFSLDKNRRVKIHNALIKGNRNDAEVLAVHIRHGDYKTWRSGRYFFDVESYKLMIRAIASLNHNKKSSLFYIASNVDVSQDFEGHIGVRGSKIIVSSSSFDDDFLTLASSKLIVGPPSTFGHWAAFLGETKRYILDSPMRQRRVVNNMMLERLPIIIWPFSAGLKNDFWQE